VTIWLLLTHGSVVFVENKSADDTQNNTKKTKANDLQNTQLKNECLN
jgi:hypothetical protein